MGRDLNRDGEAVGKCSAVNAPIVHQRSVDFVKNEADAAAIKLLWQVSDGEPNVGGIHEDFSECYLPDQLRSDGYFYPVNSA